MSELVSLLATGVLVGSVYGLFGVALVIIYRATDVLNFAMAMLATTAVYAATTALAAGLPLAPSILLGVLVGGSSGILVERVLVRPLGNDNHFAALVVMFGLSFVLVGVIGLVWGTQPRSFPTLVGGSVSFSGTQIANQRLAGGLFTCATVLLLTLFFRGRTGMKMRAAAADASAAQAIGIDTRRTARTAWFLGCGIASACAFLFASGSVVDVGLMDGVLIRSFAGVFVGGYTMVGAGVGGVLIGVLDNLFAEYVSTAYRNTFVFLTIAISLLVRPAGFFGRKTVSRV